jgi:RHS repeat-associated protein
VERSGAAASVTRHDYLPFGEEIPVALGGRTTPGENYGAPPDNLRQQFTGYERDTETGLDFAIARYYANSQGRFLSTDPYDVNMDRQYADDYERGNTILKSYILTPLRWNRYAYALNNPLRYIDPTGEKDEEIIKVRVNIVYDKGSLKTEEAARKLTAAAVADAKKTYATAGIQLEISFTPGAASTTNAENKTQAITEGRAEGAINIFVSNDLTHHTAGRSNASTGESFVNYGRGYGSFGPLAPQDDIFSHEIGHQLGPNSTNGYSNLASDLVIDRDNAFLRAGQTRQVVMKPAPGRNSTHVQTPVSREVPAMKMYREGARKYAPK